MREIFYIKTTTRDGIIEDNTLTLENCGKTIHGFLKEVAFTEIDLGAAENSGNEIIFAAKYFGTPVGDIPIGLKAKKENDTITGTLKMGLADIPFTGIKQK